MVLSMVFRMCTKTNRVPIDLHSNVSGDLFTALQSSETSVKQKSELISRMEEKTNQMAATIKQLEHR